MKLSLKDKLDGRELDLSLNELTEVPVKELAGLTKATHLDLSSNRLMALPISFSTLTFLIRLDLSKNLLTDLPHNFGNLKLLQYLDLYGNQLTMLPVSFSQLKNLRWLDLKNNPLIPRLKSVAGDCLDKKQCEKCATNVVGFMQEIEVELEKDKMKRVKEEKDKARARRYEAEQELKKQKEAKKVEKEKRKAEQKLKYLEQHRELLEQEKTEVNGNGTNLSTSEAPIRATKQKSNSIFVYIFLLLLLSPVVILLANMTMKYTTGQHPIRSSNDLKALARNEFELLRRHAELAWGVTLTKSQQYWKVALVEVSHVTEHAESVLKLFVKKGAELQRLVTENVKRLWSKWNNF